MSTIDISTLTLQELKDLKADVVKAIDARNAQAVTEARSQILAIAQGVGIPLKDLIGKAPVAATNKAPIKFRDPANSKNEWSGRGRLPNWAQTLKSAGTLDSARV